MLFLDYEQFKAKYFETQQKYNEILSEKEALFEKTQPNSIDFEKERVSGGTPRNAFDDYLIEKERKRIDDRIAEAKSLLEDRMELLKIKEQELRSSKDIHDSIYLFRFIDHRSAHWIAKRKGYSKSQVYRILHVIEKQIKDATKCDF